MCLSRVENVYFKELSGLYFSFVVVILKQCFV